jgi:hypothetical protein
MKAKELFALATMLKACPTLTHIVGVGKEYKTEEVEAEFETIMKKAVGAAEEQKTRFEIEGKILPENMKNLLELGYSVQKKNRIGFNRKEYIVVDFDFAKKKKEDSEGEDE